MHLDLFFFSFCVNGCCVRRNITVNRESFDKKDFVYDRAHGLCKQESAISLGNCIFTVRSFTVAYKSNLGEFNYKSITIFTHRDLKVSKKRFL